MEITDERKKRTHQTKDELKILQKQFQNESLSLKYIHQ